MSSPNFKVVLVGGGPVGLTAAHALTRANIDFVLLESRPSTVIDAGSDLVLLPMGMRLFSQLNLLDSFDAVSSPLSAVERYDHRGNCLGETKNCHFIHENHGHAPRSLSRHNFTKILYESLPAESQAKVLPNKKLASIDATDTGVTVHCADGSAYEGTIVIGADGAHSAVRRQMVYLAQKYPELDAVAAAAATSEEQPADDDPLNPYLTTYRCLWIRFPTATVPGLQPGSSFATHGTGATTQVFVGEETAVSAMYERLPAPTRTPQRRYNTADEAACVAAWADLPVVGATASRGALSLGQAYAARIQSGIVNLEEGVVRRWSWGGRVVLVGDAAHKFTPSTGAGCNNGIVDVVVLLNELHALLHEKTETATAPSGLPPRDRLAAVFASYQAARFAAVTAGCEGSGRATATATWETFALKFFDTWVMPSETVQRYIMSKAAAVIADTPVLNYVPSHEQLHGKVTWTKPMKTPNPAVAC